MRDYISRPQSKVYRQAHAATFGEGRPLSFGHYLEQARPDETYEEWRARKRGKQPKDKRCLECGHRDHFGRECMEPGGYEANEDDSYTATNTCRCGRMNGQDSTATTDRGEPTP